MNQEFKAYQAMQQDQTRDPANKLIDDVRNALVRMGFKADTVVGSPSPDISGRHILVQLPIGAAVRILPYLGKPGPRITVAVSVDVKDKVLTDKLSYSSDAPTTTIAEDTIGAVRDLVSKELQTVYTKALLDQLI